MKEFVVVSLEASEKKKILGGNTFLKNLDGMFSRILAELIKMFQQLVKKQNNSCQNGYNNNLWRELSGIIHN